MVKKIVYLSADFDPTLCSGVSASVFDLFKYCKTLGFDACIESFSPSWVDHARLKSTITKMGGEIEYSDTKTVVCELQGIKMSSEKQKYPRSDLLFNKKPEVLRKFLEKIEKYPEALFLTTDIDLTSIMAHVIAKSTFVHHVHSPVCFLDVLKGSPPFYTSFLKNRRIFSVSSTAEKIVQKAEISSFVWNPFIDCDRCIFKKQSVINNKIGYYSAGAHKGDELVKYLLKALPEHHFTIMGNGSGIFQGLPNTTVLGKETNLNTFYADVSIILIPSIIQEGFSRMAIEAAANGIPVIANEIGGIPEALADSGILVLAALGEKETAKQYVDNIKLLYSDNDFYNQLSQKAYKRAENYTKNIKKMSSNYINDLLN